MPDTLCRITRMGTLKGSGFHHLKAYLAKYLSLMFSGTDTLEMSSFVEVATRYLWFTLLRRRRDSLLQLQH